jgi:hypothetical protein
MTLAPAAAPLAAESETLMINGVQVYKVDR